MAVSLWHVMDCNDKTTSTCERSFDNTAAALCPSTVKVSRGICSNP
jgi:hypothetical protein